MKKHNKILIYVKENYRLVVLVLLLSFLLFYKAFLGNHNIGFCNDDCFQYRFFYAEWIRILKDCWKRGDYPFYSWYSFLGTDYWSSKLYYCTLDLFLPVVLLVKDVGFGLILEDVLCLLTGALLMKRYLRIMGIQNNNYLDMGALMYSLSGSMILMTGNYMFVRFLAFLPLLFIGCEQYLTQRKRVLFTFSVFLLFCQNYYFMYSASCFLIGYFIASSYSKGETSLGRILLSAIPLIGAYLVGILMTMAALLPNALFMMKNSRLMYSDSKEVFYHLKVYISLLCSHLVPNFNVFTKIPFMFYDGESGYNHWYSLYLSVLGLVCLISGIRTNKDKKRWPFIVLNAVFYLFLLIRPLNSIIHVLSSPSFRWGFLFSITEIFLIASFLENENIEKRDIYSYSLVTALVVCSLLFANVVGIIQLSKYLVHLTAIISAILLGYIYLALLRKKKEKAVFIILVLELTLSSFATVQLMTRNSANNHELVDSGYVSYFISREDNQLTRMYFADGFFAPESELNVNQSLYYQYMSTRTYDTTYEGILNPFLSYVEENPFSNFFNINDPEIMRVLGVRYFGISDYEVLPESNIHFQYVFNIGPAHIYEIEDYYSIAHTYSRFVTQNEFTNKNDFDWENVLIVSDSDLGKLNGIKLSEKRQLNIRDHTNNSFDGEISVDGKQILFTSIPFSDGWRINDQNGRILETICADGGFLCVILPNAGEYTLHYRYVSPGFKLGLLSSFIGFCLFALILVREKSRLSYRNSTEGVG